MPSIIFCKRRWQIGSDDLVFPAFVESFIRGLWLVGSAVLTFEQSKYLDCDPSAYIHSYLIGQVILLATIIILNILIISQSARGTIIQDRPRKYVSTLLTVRFAFAVFETSWNVYGTIWAFPINHEFCEPKAITLTVQILIIGSWILLIFMVIGMFLVFDPMGNVTIKSTENGSTTGQPSREYHSIYVSVDPLKLERAEKIWRSRMKYLCCLCQGFNDTAQPVYNSIAQLLAEFGQDVDIVPSDIVAGLILLQKEQWKAESRLELSEPPENTSIPVDDSHPNWMTLETAWHYFKYAKSSYGWPQMLYDEFCTGCCQLCRGVRKGCCCIRSEFEGIIGDNVCSCGLSSVKHMAQLKDDDIIYMNFNNQIYQVPFFVAFDHPTKTVVVSIRGTLSFDDALTDLTCVGELIPNSEHLCQGALCHAGSLKAALYVRQTLNELRILETCFAERPDYELLITGHSLGGGAASALAIMLKSTYPELKCICFSAPGGLLSLNIALKTQDFIMCIILGDDFVPRLSLPAVLDLKKRVVEAIMNCNKPKYKVLLSGIFQAILKGKCCPSSRSADHTPAARPLIPSRRLSTASFLQYGGLEANGHSKLERQSSLKANENILYLPGRIMHITLGSDGPVIYWATVEDFRHIAISPHMISDHLPSVLEKVLSAATQSEPIKCEPQRI